MSSKHLKNYLMYSPQKTSALSSRIHPDIVVSSGVPEIDRVLQGFHANQITYIQGKSPLTKMLPYQVCVNTYKMFHSSVLFIDGGNMMNPYHLARCAQYQELSAKTVLTNVQISRAFTVHQLNTLIDQQIEPMLKRYHPQTIIINAFPRLYMDTDVSCEEAENLLQHALTRIQQMTTTYQLITLLTHPYAHCDTSERLLSPLLFRMVDEMIQVTQMKHCPRVYFPRHQHTVTITEGVQGQLCLPDFGMVTR